MTDRFLRSLGMAEVAGKNAAIGAYDHMIWTVRSGFLTVFFGGWGFLLKTLLETRPLTRHHYAIIGATIFLSGALAGAAAQIDRNYVRRKFRVIASLNHLLDGLSRLAVEANSTAQNSLISELRVAGDTDDLTYKISGYERECEVGRLIYLVPIFALLCGIALIGVVHFTG